MKRRHGTWSAMLWSAAAIASAAGQPTSPATPPPPPPAPLHATAVPRPAMPDDVAAAVLVDEGSAWRGHEATVRLLAILVQADALRAHRDAWAELAAAIGMDEAAAFDALLGTRAVLTIGPDLAGSPSWGLLTTVKPETATRLNDKLDPAPRGFESGERVVLAERGRFRLNKFPGEGEGADPRFVLTPAAMSGTSDLARRSAAALEAEPREPGEILAYWRASEKGAYILGRIAREPRGLSAKLRASPEIMDLTPAALTTIAKADAAAMTDDDATLLEVAGRIPRELPLVKDQTALLSSLLRAARITVPPAELTGDRSVIRVAKENGVVTLTAASEIHDLARASEAFDGMLASLLELASAAGGINNAAAAGGVRAEIERVRNDPIAVRLAVLGRGKMGSATMAWTYVPSGRENPTSGWWVMQYRAADAGRDNTEQLLRIAAGEVAGRAWGRSVLRVIARPAKFWEAMGLERAGEEAAPLGFLREIDRVNLELTATASEVVGTGRVELMPAPTPPTPAAPTNPPAAAPAAR